jgi:hypothetical protein
MANLFLTGSGVPNNTVGEITDYYRDTATNLIYYRSPLGWEAVPSLIPTPDGVGTNWLFGTGAPDNGVGAANDYYRDDANGTIYRKHSVNGWESKGSLDFIGVYGVQWGEGSGAPANTPPLNNLPAGSFYLDVVTSDIYYKDPSLTWSLKGQLGGGGGGGGSVTVINNLTSTSTTAALSANMGKYIADQTASSFSIAFSSINSIQTTINNYGNIVNHNTAEFDPAGTATAAQLAAQGYADGAATAAQLAAQGYADGLVVGLLDDRGNYDPSFTSLYPTNGGSGASGAVLKGDLWAISADGNVNGIAVTVGDTIRALVNSPAQNNANWAITQNNLIYVPENTTNKVTSLASPDNTKYPTSQAVATALADYATIANQRYQFVADAGTTYTVPASSVTENGRTIIELSNNSLTSITINAATGTGKIVGDSVNISITGTYAAQALVASGVTLQGDLTFSYQHQTKTLVYKGSNTWKVVG